MADESTRAWSVIYLLFALVVVAVVADIVSTDYNLPAVFYGPIGLAISYAIKRSIDALESD